ncbi:MAG: Hint domain-containing protein, partial [Paracoccaceae bacterium]|nr:Hint domain-containing protein [Paracoccaceae bacterium]
IVVQVFNPNGSLRSTNSVVTLAGTISGKDVYVINTGIHKNGAVALVDNGSVLSFVSFDRAVTARPGTGAAAGMTSTQVGSTGNNTNASLVDDGTGSYSVQTPPDSGVIPCFLSGTRIATRVGQKLVENLKAGDEIVCSHGGYARLKWAGSVTMAITSRSSQHAPIRIPRGAMGHGLPKRDLIVSPNHRVLMSSPENELYFSEPEVLIAAKHLIGWQGIKVDTSVNQVTYHHLLFDQHQIIVSEGLFTESFHPGDAALSGMDRATIWELLTLFPELALEENGYGNTARPCLKSYETEIATKLVG